MSKSRYFVRSMPDRRDPLEPAPPGTGGPSPRITAGRGYEYSAVATNKSLQIAPMWHFMAGRGAHEKTYAELKQHFGFAAIPTNDKAANSAWQLISVLTLNLMRYFQITVGATERSRTWKRTFDYVFQSMQTLRFELIQQPARLVRPKGQPELRFAASRLGRKRIETIDRGLRRAA